MYLSSESELHPALFSKPVCFFFLEMSAKTDDRLSRLLSKLLRHSGDKEGLAIAADGFVLVDNVLGAASVSKLKPKPDFPMLERVVKNNDKQRFAMKCDDEKKWWIRANQGHSISTVVSDELLKELKTEDEILAYPTCVHGTYLSAWPTIKEKGLSKMARRHIHFASNLSVPLGSKKTISGMRADVEVIIHINMLAAFRQGIKFFVSDNNVILSEGNQEGFISAKFFKRVDFKPTANEKDVKMNELDNKKTDAVPVVYHFTAQQLMDRLKLVKHEIALSSTDDQLQSIVDKLIK